MNIKRVRGVSAAIFGGLRRCFMQPQHALMTLTTCTSANLHPSKNRRGHHPSRFPVSNTTILIKSKPKMSLSSYSHLAFLKLFKPWPSPFSLLQHLLTSTNTLRNHSFSFNPFSIFAFVTAPQRI
jgi:hypothetical protein